MAAWPRHLGGLDSRSFAKVLQKNPVVVVPVGALEAHGPHLPLAADQIQAEATAVALAERLDGWVAPSLPYGVCSAARRFPGTVTLTLETLAATATELLEELVRHGAKRLVLLSGHAEAVHMAALRSAAETVARAHPEVRIVVLSDYDFVYELRGRDAPETDGHGGLLETSRLLALAPDRVGPVRPVVTNRPSRFVAGDPAEWTESVQGDTRPATAELGRKVQAHVLDRLESTIRAVLPA